MDKKVKTLLQNAKGFFGFSFFGPVLSDEAGPFLFVSLLLFSFQVALYLVNRLGRHFLTPSRATKAS
jgi:hypothetical protein